MTGRQRQERSLNGVSARPQPWQELAGARLRVGVRHSERESESAYELLTTLSVGRELGNAIQLDDAAVAPSHVLIKHEESGVVLTVLSKLKPVRLGDQQLSIERRYVWRSGQVLRIGPFELRLLDERAQPALGDGYGAAGDTLRVVLEPGKERLTLIPGKTVAVAVRVTNDTRVEDSVRITVDGLPAAWAEVLTPVLRLAPGAADTTIVQIQVPHLASALAREYPVRVRAQSQLDGGGKGETPALWIVQSFRTSQLNVRPIRRGAGWQAYSVLLTNNGNLPQSYGLELDHSLEALDYEFSAEPGTVAQRRMSARRSGEPDQARAEQVVVSPGQTSTAQLTLRNAVRFAGATRTYPVTVRAVPDAGDELSVATRFVDRPVLPVWQLLLGLLAVAVVALFAAFSALQSDNAAQRSEPMLIASPGVLPEAVPAILAFSIISDTVPLAGEAITATWNVTNTERLVLQPLARELDASPNIAHTQRIAVSSGGRFFLEASNGGRTVRSQVIDVNVVSPSCTISMTAILRDGPGDTYAARAQLPKGTPLTFRATAVDGKWVLVLVQNSDVTGWIQKSEIDCGDLKLERVLTSLKPGAAPLQATATPTATPTTTPTPTSAPTAAPAPSTTQTATAAPPGQVGAPADTAAPAPSITPTSTPTPTPSADLQITQSISPNPVTAGGTFNFTLTVSNNGPDVATSVRVTVVLPPAMASNVQFSANEWQCDTSGCTLGTLPVGAAPAITILVRAPDPGAFTLTANVSAASTDALPANNSTIRDLTVNAAPTLTPNTIAAPEVSLVIDTDKIALEGSFKLTYKIRNPNRNTALTGIVFQHILPAGLEFEDNTKDDCSGTFKAEQSTHIISLSGGELRKDSNDVCEYTIKVTGATPGVKNMPTLTVTSNAAPGTVEAKTVVVYAPPVITIDLKDKIISDSETSITVNVHNPNSVEMTGISFNINVDLEQRNKENSCGAKRVNNTLIIERLQQSGSCTIEVNVKPGSTKRYIVSNIKFDPNGRARNSNTAVLIKGAATAPPVLTQAFSPSEIANSGTTRLTFTIMNPNQSPATALDSTATPSPTPTPEPYGDFTSTLPEGLVVQDSAITLGGSCGGGQPVVNQDEETKLWAVSLSGAAVPPGEPCTVSVQIQANAPGFYLWETEVDPPVNNVGHNSSLAFLIVE
jgi:uncharacterized repeat protein (TIGR01451 family)